jgi:hypothetical protein
VPTTNVAVTQGIGIAAGVTNGQPAMLHGTEASTVGFPATVTRGFGAVGCAWPP